MTTADGTRTWVWISLLVQGLGYAFDALWHGTLRPGAEPATYEAMLRHLLRVHLPLYVGAASLLIATATLLTRRRHGARVAARVAFAGAVLSVGAEVWHAASHLQLDTHAGPVAGTLSFVGFVIALGAMVFSRRRRRRDAVDASRDRHAA
jgi:lipopolysaccharide export LptBFGC system permease protein LptF